MRYTLISDGVSDANLIPIIDWVLKQEGKVALTEGRYADLWRLPDPPRNLTDRMLKAVEFFPCEILFVHRDAEKEPPQSRRAEISDAFQRAHIPLPAVAVIPVRMLEAWLCFSEPAVRKAAGNPNGKAPLCLPTLQRTESRPSPKTDLRNALLTASELSGRRRKKFDTKAAFWRIVDYIDDFSPLHALPAFIAFERSVKQLSQNDWRPGFYG